MDGLRVCPAGLKEGSWSSVSPGVPACPMGPLGVIFGGLGGVLEALWMLLGGSWELQVAPQLSFKALWDPLAASIMLF